MRLINPSPDTVYLPSLNFEFGPGEEHDVDLGDIPDEWEPPVPLEKPTADARKRAKQYRTADEPADAAPAAAKETTE